jgi:hypothetical protein
MSDGDPQYDELRRRLADEGSAKAPPDLADHVMHRVRAEPRARDRRVLRPLLTLAAAALITGAALVGVTHINPGSSSSASSGAGGGQAASSAPQPQKETAGGAVDAQGVIVRHVSRDALGPLVGAPRAAVCQGADRIAVSVPAQAFSRVARSLRAAVATDAAVGRRTLDVELHRAPKGQARIRVTCP